MQYFFSQNDHSQLSTSSLLLNKAINQKLFTLYGRVSKDQHNSTSIYSEAPVLLGLTFGNVLGCFVNCKINKDVCFFEYSLMHPIPPIHKSFYLTSYLRPTNLSIIMELLQITYKKLMTLQIIHYYNDYIFFLKQHANKVNSLQLCDFLSRTHHTRTLDQRTYFENELPCRYCQYCEIIF